MRRGFGVSCYVTFEVLVNCCLKEPMQGIECLPFIGVPSVA